MQEKRNRGRPLGRKFNDDDAMSKVADLVVQQGIRPGTAIRHVVETAIVEGASQAAKNRRLRMRWDQGKTALLEAARKRHIDRRTPMFSTGARYAPRTVSEILRKSFEDLERNPLVRAQRATESLEGAASKALQRAWDQMERERKLMQPYEEAMRFNRLLDRADPLMPSF